MQDRSARCLCNRPVIKYQLTISLLKVASKAAPSQQRPHCEAQCLAKAAVLTCAWIYIISPIQFVLCSISFIMGVYAIASAQQSVPYCIFFHWRVWST